VAPLLEIGKIDGHVFQPSLKELHLVVVLRIQGGRNLEHFIEKTNSGLMGCGRPAPHQRVQSGTMKSRALNTYLLGEINPACMARHWYGARGPRPCVTSSLAGKRYNQVTIFLKLDTRATRVTVLRAHLQKYWSLSL